MSQIPIIINNGTKIWIKARKTLNLDLENGSMFPEELFLCPLELEVAEHPPGMQAG